MNTLIVVDDEPAFADLVVKVATAARYEARAAASAEALLKDAETGWPSVLVLDLQMPDTDGIELLSAMGERRCPSKVVLISGMDGRVLDSAFRLGSELGLAMAGKVLKPVRVQDLRQLLAGLNEDDSKPTPEALSSAIAEDRLFLDYQPKVEISTRRMVGVEALVRWRDRSGRIIMPDELIPLAENSGLMDQVTAAVVRDAFRQAGEWRRKGFDLTVAVNLSAQNIHDRQLPNLLAAQCAAAGLPPAAVTLELTETASAREFSTLLEILGRFRLKGFHLSIDDFGTGYSSVAQLLRLLFSELKVDKSFVSDMAQSREAMEVTKTLVDMAHNLGLPVVAEGVESDGILAMLANWGCDFGQGYLFSRPTTPEAVEAMAAT